MRIFARLAAALSALFTLSCGSVSETIIVAAPTELSAQAGYKQVILSWNPNETATSYRLYYKTSSTPGDGGVTAADRYIEVPEASGSYEHTDLTNFIHYFYRVAAVTGGGTVGDLSNEVEAIPFVIKPDSPTGLAATTDTTTITLSWSGVDRAEWYTVYYKTGAGVGAGDHPTRVTGTSHKLTGLAAGTTYYFRVSAGNEAGESDLSSEVNVVVNGGGGGVGGTGCIDPHGAPGGMSVAKEVAYCATQTNYRISGEFSGVNLNNGRMTARIVGMGDMNPPTMTHFILMHGVANNGYEENIHMGIWGDNPENLRLVHHSWMPSLQASKSQTAFSFKPGVTYTVDMQWNPSTLTVTIAGSDGANATPLSISWKSPFKSFSKQALLFGNNIYNGKVGANAKVTAIRVTAFK